MFSITLPCQNCPRAEVRFPGAAWHFALAALGDRKEGGEIRTTLDQPVQALLERTLASSLAPLQKEITAAGVVMDNTTGEILAYTGNARLGSGMPGSWVDCGKSPRSPGSALKPFAYLAAFERGILTPASLLADTPLAFLGNAPRNFDLVYRGPVTARTALSDSLNVPSVRVLRAAGQEYNGPSSGRLPLLTKPAGLRGFPYPGRVRGHPAPDGRGVRNPGEPGRQAHSLVPGAGSAAGQKGDPGRPRLPGC